MFLISLEVGKDRLKMNILLTNIRACIYDMSRKSGSHGSAGESGVWFISIVRHN